MHGVHILYSTSTCQAASMFLINVSSNSFSYTKTCGVLSVDEYAFTFILCDKRKINALFALQIIILHVS